ncbi:aspartate racemase/maleate isomerase family protein [Pseudochelatococcus sp. B33]
MFEDAVPKKVIGCLLPLEPNDYVAYEFYRLAPPGVMSAYVSVGLRTFTKEDVLRAFEPIDRLVDMLTDRNVDILLQSGVPLPILMGVEEHDSLLDRMRKRSGKPVTSSITAVVNAAEHLGIKRIVAINKWTGDMNGVLARFFARRGITVEGVGAEVMFPEQFKNLSTVDGMQLAYELARKTLNEHPKADGLYIGGGAWLVLPVAQMLEKEFGIPAISNQDCTLWDTLHKIDYWRPRPGLTRLLGGD